MALQKTKPSFDLFSAFHTKKNKQFNRVTPDWKAQQHSQPYDIHHSIDQKKKSAIILHQPDWEAQVEVPFEEDTVVRQQLLLTSAATAPVKVTRQMITPAARNA